ncbi:hypothetical protein [Streptomyces lydicus]|uniref:hypothetical protein n=1 Tax=Streptomyces lydicus TaxID=47763 RepID=UPI0037B0DCCD
MITQASPGVPGEPEAADGFGTAVAASADLDRDGKAEALVGVPYENADGCVWVARGTATGPATTGSTNLSGRDAGLTLRGFHGLFGAALPGAHIAF